MTLEKLCPYSLRRRTSYKVMSRLYKESSMQIKVTLNDMQLAVETTYTKVRIFTDQFNTINTKMGSQ